MKVDHFYTIGCDHDECQDYSLSRIWENGLAFICVADGCSSSHNECGSVDLGARLLSFSAEYILKGITKRHNTVDSIYDLFCEDGKHHELGDLIATFAKNSLQNLMSQEDSLYTLDSTLLICIADKNKALVFAYGDGVVDIEYKDGRKECHDIEYSEIGPCLISYLKNSERCDLYQQGRHALRVSDLRNKMCHMDYVADDIKKYFSWSCFVVEDFKRISLLSDGVHSFESDDGKKADVVGIVDELTKDDGSEYFVRDNVKEFIYYLESIHGQSPYDDVSVATLLKEE